jgi:5-formyltetrahydrofolate cyclo-ligase
LSDRNAKEAARRDLLEKRLQLSAPERDSAAEKAKSLFFTHVKLQKYSIVAGYWPIRGELDVRPLLQEILGLGHACALPHVVAQGHGLDFRDWDNSTPMTTGKYGISEPLSGKDIIPDIILVPMAAFDANRHRLGYGKGYYDRTLAHLRTKKDVLAVGMAYDWQKCGPFPVEPHDVKMDMIITDKNVYK